MTADELDALLTVARKHDLQQLHIEGQMTAVLVPRLPVEEPIDIEGLQQNISQDDIKEAEAKGLLYGSSG